MDDKYYRAAIRLCADPAIELRFATMDLAKHIAGLLVSGDLLVVVNGRSLTEQDNKQASQ